MEVKNIVGFAIVAKSSYYKDSDGCEIWHEFDEFGIIIYCKNSAGYEYIGVRDNENPRLYHYTDNDGESWTNEYDEYGNIIRYENAGRNFSYIAKYDVITKTITD